MVELVDRQASLLAGEELLDRAVHGRDDRRSARRQDVDRLVPPCRASRFFEVVAQIVRAGSLDRHDEWFPAERESGQRGERTAGGVPSKAAGSFPAVTTAPGGVVIGGVCGGEVARGAFWPRPRRCPPCCAPRVSGSEPAGPPEKVVERQGSREEPEEEETINVPREVSARMVQVESIPRGSPACPDATICASSARPSSSSGCIRATASYRSCEGSGVPWIP